VTYNRMFDVGNILPFKSAGNSGDDDPTICDINLPGNASAAFTVAQARTNGTLASNARSGDGTSGGRTMVDITGPGTMAFPYVDWPGGPPPTSWYGTWTSGTSIATPYVAGMGALVQEFLETHRSHLSVWPGVLKANLLLMGNRMAGNSTVSTPVTLNYGFDAETGAGFIQPRTWSSAGGDLVHDEDHFITGWACVGRNENVYFYLPVSRARELDAVAVWVDRGHETGSPAQEIDLEVGTYDTSTGVFTHLNVDGRVGDDKERAYYYTNAVPAPRRPAIRIISHSGIYGTDPVCGENREHVYFAFRAEKAWCSDDPTDPCPGW